MKFRSALAALGAVGAFATPVHADPLGSPPRIVLAVDGVGETRNLPVLLAERLGYFRDEGLTVTLADAPGEPSPGQLMADGRADGAVAFYHHTFMTQADDHLVTRSVVSMGISPGLKVVVAGRLRGKIQTLADLKGLRIITGGRNSGKTTTANWLALHWGYGLAGYTPLPLASREAMAAELRDGTADVIIAHEPDASAYVAEGAFELADIESATGTRAALGTVFPSTALYLPKAYIAAHPREVQRLVDACLKALKYINSHDAADIVALLPPKVVGSNKVAFIRLVAQDKQMFASDGLTPEEAARAEWRAMTALTPKYGAIRFEETYANAFVQASHDQVAVDASASRKE